MTEDPQMMRHWNLLRMLGARRLGVTVRELARELGVTEKTIRRDLDFLRQMGVPVGGTDGGLRPEGLEAGRVLEQAAAAVHLRGGGGLVPGPAIAGADGRYAVLVGGPARLAEDPQHAGRDGIGIPRPVLADVPLHGGRPPRLCEQGGDPRDP